MLFYGKVNMTIIIKRFFEFKWLQTVNGSLLYTHMCCMVLLYIYTLRAIDVVYMATVREKTWEKENKEITIKFKEYNIIFIPRRAYKHFG